ncbi:hypothetical protein J1605_006954 [Eschrichtius robustus]|uniref:Uncharacterized protein n=1 Tax=Eschrichtius robustus TaxID=9764 RepID=A0AB34H2S3_ESCRO|nr:hypothetical protein J1605_006954 [Eschrichtius robustus]
MLAVTRADTAPSRLLPAPPERSRALRPTRPGVPVVWQARALRRRDPLAPWRPHCCSLLSPPPDRDPTCPQLGDPQLNRCSVKSEERPPAPSAVWPAIPGVQRRELGVDEATEAAAKGGARQGGPVPTAASEGKESAIHLCIRQIPERDLDEQNSSLWQWSGLYFVNPGVLACVKAVQGRKKKQKMQLLASRTLIFWLEGCEGSRTFAWSSCTHIRAKNLAQISSSLLCAQGFAPSMEEVLCTYPTRMSEVMKVSSKKSANSENDSHSYPCVTPPCGQDVATGSPPSGLPSAPSLCRQGGGSPLREGDTELRGAWLLCRHPQPLLSKPAPSNPRKAATRKPRGPPTANGKKKLDPSHKQQNKENPHPLAPECLWWCLEGA